MTMGQPGLQIMFCFTEIHLTKQGKAIFNNKITDHISRDLTKN